MKQQTVYEQRKASIALDDGLENLVTGLGTSKDNNSHNRWSHSGNNRDGSALLARYREDWVAKKICTIIPQDMTREWRSVDNEDVAAFEVEFDLKRHIFEAQKWANVLGTAAILLDVRGSGPLEQPLRTRRLKKGCIRGMQVIDRTRLFPIGGIEMDSLDPNYGNPTFYQIGGSTKRIHASRLIRFEGTELPKYEYWRNTYWSDSILIPLMTTIDNFHVAAQSAAALTQEASLDVVSVKGLSQLLTNPTGEALLMKRFRLMKRMKSIHNMVVLDETEEYTTKSVSLSGLKDLMWEYLRVIAAATGIPATRFLSDSPSGMNSTGASDLNNYIDLVKAEQEHRLGTRLKLLDPIIEAHVGASFTYEWNCVFPESQQQKQERDGLLVASLKDLVDSGIIAAASALEILKDKEVFGDINLKVGTPQGNADDKGKDKKPSPSK